MTQLNDSFEYLFKTLETTVNDNQSNTDNRFTEINKYIRFVDGNIILGTSENEITLKIENAYFKNRKLYVQDGEFINSLKLGKFAFTPRANGNLSFGKVVE